MAHSLQAVNPDSVGAQFWVQPELAAQMWVSYNKRLLWFAKAHPERTLVVTQRALFDGAPLLQEMSSKFGFVLDSDCARPFDRSLFRDKASRRVQSLLSSSLQSQLNTLWDELLSVATFRTTNEQPHFVDEELPSKWLKTIQHRIASKSVSFGQAGETQQDNGWLKKCLAIDDASEMVHYLANASLQRLSGVELAQWLPIVEQRFEVDGAVKLALAKLLMRLNQHQHAITRFQDAVTLGVYYPYIDMLLGQCWQALDVPTKAEFFFRKAITSNPNNPVFYTHYAQLLRSTNRGSDAELQFKLGYEKGRHQAACVIPYCEFLSEMGKVEEAIVLAKSFLDETPKPNVQQLLVRLTLKRDVQQGKAHYSTMVKDKLANKNIADWLANTCHVLHSAQAESDFIVRCINHWDELGLLDTILNDQIPER
jgi:tetratricopeptide (TPR) repeat protein